MWWRSSPCKSPPTSSKIKVRFLEEFLAFTHNEVRIHKWNSSCIFGFLLICIIYIQAGKSCGYIELCLYCLLFKILPFYLIAHSFHLLWKSQLKAKKWIQMLWQICIGISFAVGKHLLSPKKKILLAMQIQHSPNLLSPNSSYYFGGETGTYPINQHLNCQTSLYSEKAWLTYW